MSIEVSGHSDDLIEVEGDITEEFSNYSDDEAILAFSNGVVLRVKYDDNGVWRIRPIANPSQVSIEFAPEGDDDNYSDKATILTPASWVVLGREIAVAR